VFFAENFDFKVGTGKIIDFFRKIIDYIIGFSEPNNRKIITLNTTGRLYFDSKYSKLLLNKKTMDLSSFSGIFNIGLQQFPVKKLKLI
jgi:hypothetical protein